MLEDPDAVGCDRRTFANRCRRICRRGDERVAGARCQQQDRETYLAGMRVPCIAVVLSIAIVRFAPAQTWQGATQVLLVQRAISQRGMRDADARLTGWRARAHGVVRLASVVEHGGLPVERVIKADELRVEVYGEAPNRSKQVIVAWRDTTFLPNRIVYHRDHLGIVANDFGAMILLGDGDEVREVAHPLSPPGAEQHEFAMGDTVVIRGARGLVRVVAVQVRPRDATLPGTIGTLYLDVDRATLVRFRFTFTPASYRDPTVEDITVTLENALHEGRWWLPWRQSIVIRRGTAWLALPLRSVIRADWTIDDYELGVRHTPNQFAGPLVAGLRRPVADQAVWDHPLASQLDGLPGTEDDVDAVRRAAAMAVGQVISGMPRTRLGAGGVSDLVSVNRIHGVTLGAGARVALSPMVSTYARIAYGLSDDRVTGDATVEVRGAATRWSFAAFRQLRDVSDLPIISGALNSLRTAVGGDDRLDWTLIEGIRAAVRHEIEGFTLEGELAREWSWSVRPAFTPVAGGVPPNPALGVGGTTVARVRGAAIDPTGEGWRVALEAGDGERDWARIAAQLRTSTPVGGGRVQVALEAGAGTTHLPGYRSFVLGGRASLPGVAHRALGGRSMARIEVAWARSLNLPTPPLPGVRGVRLPSAMMPFIAVGVASGSVPGVPWQASGRAEPVVGLRLDLWGPLLRVESGISLRTGSVAVTVDVHPDWWPVM